MNNKTVVYIYMKRELYNRWDAASISNYICMITNTFFLFTDVTFFALKSTSPWRQYSSVVDLMWTYMHEDYIFVSGYESVVQTQVNLEVLFYLGHENLILWFSIISRRKYYRKKKKILVQFFSRQQKKYFIHLASSYKYI